MSRTPHRTDFFVIGVVKGGTTSLYDYLNQHPDIYLPPIKEINHFSQADIDEDNFLPEYARDVKLDLQQYFAKGMREMIHIAHVNGKEDYARLYEPSRTDQKKGDISNSYMICPSTAEEIHKHNPDSKIIVILRNPIRRAWSQYLMNLRESKADREDFIKEVKSDASQSLSGWGVNHQYLELGKYAQQLQRYYDLFPKSQILPILFEEYAADPDGTLKTVCEFLGISSSFQFDTESKKNTASLPRNKQLNDLLVKSGMIKAAKGIVPRKLRQKASGVLYTDKDLPSITKAEKNILRDYYSTEVDALTKLLDRDLTDFWPEFKTEVS